MEVEDQKQTWCFGFGAKQQQVVEDFKIMIVRDISNLNINNAQNTYSHWQRSQRQLSTGCSKKSQLQIANSMSCNDAKVIIHQSNCGSVA